MTLASAATTDPILIYGAPRSGTTYLRTIVDTHPEVTLTHELCVFDWLHAASHALDQHADWFRAREALPGSIRDRLMALVRHHYDGLGAAARWWGDKNPHYARDPAILRTAATLFPRAKFVHIHRDPRAVLASLLQKRHADGRPWIGVEDAHVLVVGHVQNALAFGREVGPQRAYQLRYENLVHDDLGQARALFHWLGIPIAAPVEELCRAQALERTNYSGPTSDLRRAGQADHAEQQWRKIIQKERLRESLQFLAPILLELGYEDEASLDARNRALPG